MNQKNGRDLKLLRIYEGNVIVATNSTNHQVSCYSDEELEEFKTMIFDRISSANSIILSTSNELKKVEHEINDPSVFERYMSSDEQIETKSYIASLCKIIDRQKKFIVHLRNALTRIEFKTYGICRITGKLIPKARLRVVPHATLCVEAKEQLNAQKGCS